MPYFERPKPPHDWRWWLGLVGRTLITAGILLFGFVAYQLWGTGIQTAQAQAADPPALTAIAQRSAAAAQETVKIGLIPCAMGGSKIEEWAPGTKNLTAMQERLREAQKAGVLKGILRTIIASKVLGRISAEGEDVAHPGLGVTLQDGGDVGLAVAHTGEVRNGIERGGSLDSNDEVMRELTRGTARAVGDADKRRFESLEFADGLIQRFKRLGALRREELK